jgi:hypothetical protein
MQRFNFSQLALFNSARRQAALKKLANSMLLKLGMALGCVAVGLLMLVLGWKLLGGMSLALGAFFFLGGAWSAIKRDSAKAAPPPNGGA